MERWMGRSVHGIILISLQNISLLQIVNNPKMSDNLTLTEDQIMTPTERVVFWIAFITGTISVWLPKPINVLLSSLFEAAYLKHLDSIIVLINHCLSTISIMIVIVIGLPKAAKILKNFKEHTK